MFEAEVDIMTDVIKHLNQKGIEVLYVYDALLCEVQDKTIVIETMNRTILEHGVKTSVKDDVATASQTVSPKYRLEDEINLYEILRALSFSVPESMAIIDGLNSSKVSMRELVTYISYQRKQQVYKDYQGVEITPEIINQLKAMIIS